MLDSLKGIQKERDVKERPESTLEKLLNVEKGMRKEYAGKVSGDVSSDSWRKDHDTIYLPMHSSLSVSAN